MGMCDLVMRTFRMGPFDGDERVIERMTVGTSIPSTMRDGRWDRYKLDNSGEMIWQGEFKVADGGMLDPLLPMKGRVG